MDKDDKGLAADFARWRTSRQAVVSDRQLFDRIASAIERLSPIPIEPTEGDGKMQRVSDVIKYFTDVLERFGDSCAYVRRGGVAWGAVALNRRDDDRAHGVFDLQAQHDRDMGGRLGQIERLIADRNEWRERATKAEAALTTEATLEPEVEITGVNRNGVTGEIVRLTIWDDRFKRSFSVIPLSKRNQV